MAKQNQKTIASITLIILVAGIIGFALLNANPDSASWQMSSINSDGNIGTPSGGYRFSLVTDYIYTATEKYITKYLSAEATIKATRYFDAENTGTPFYGTINQRVRCDYQGTEGLLYVYRGVVNRPSDWDSFWNLASCTEWGCTGYEQVHPGNRGITVELASAPNQNPQSATYVCWSKRDSVEGDWIWVTSAYSFWNLPPVTSGPEPCVPDWRCSAWTFCGSAGPALQERLCVDRNECGTEAGKPDERQSCVPEGTTPDDDDAPVDVEERSFLTWLTNLFSNISSFFRGVFSL